MAAGRVVTGFSKPYVAKYTASGSSVTYSNCMRLARGVEVSLEVNSGEDNTFYADNQAAENDGGRFTGGTITYTVDGLKPEAKRLILGTPEEDSEGWTAYGDGMSVPYVGVGHIVRYMEDAKESYVAHVFTKTKFSTPADNASTQEDAIEWQTNELSSALMRDDTAAHNWKFESKEYDSEAEAEAALIAKLGGISED